MSHHTAATGNEYVAILDAGSQFGKVIDRKVRELHVETIILPLDTPTAQLRDDVRLKAVIISGGPSSVYGDDAPRYHADLFTELNKPILGICYGMQLMVRDLGGSIERKSVREDGQDVVAVDTDSILFRGMDANQHVLLTHGDSVSSVGEDFKIIATSSSGIVAAVQSKSRPICGVQFHPEVDLTVHGQSMFRNFLESAGCQFGFTMADREATAIELIRQRTSDGQQVLCLVSGGVDSTVCAALLLKAIGPERLICIHIDHGFMRLNESSAVVEALSAIGVLVHRIDAADDFANATTSVPAKGSKPAYVTRPLKASVSPEDKRHIIGNTFMTVCDKVTASMKLSVDNLLLAQGTLRPDLIESGSHLASNKADAIKTHHNDTELVRALRSRGKIIEPLSEYHKDEVRELGRNLGLPDALVMRQPFPGPGLAIRTLCTEEPALGATYDATRAVLSRLEDPASNTDEQASHVLRQASGSMSKLNLFATVLPIRTVGVQGDGRTYSNAVMLTTRRDSPDATVPWTQDEWVELLQLARLIPQVAHHANRVVFGFGPALSISPTTITPTTLTLDVIDRIRIADDIVGQHLIRHNLVKKLSQVPVVLIPLGFEKGDTAHSVVIRTFLTNDFMTGIPATPGTENMPLDVLGAIVRDLQALPFVGRVLFDLTAKPPGTTEWE